jgi:hypothetical protein
MTGQDCTYLSDGSVLSDEQNPGGGRRFEASEVPGAEAHHAGGMEVERSLQWLICLNGRTDTERKIYDGKN